MLDVDGNEGWASLATLEKEHGSLPDSYSVRTGSGGQHLYFVWPEGAEVRNSARKIAPGLDIRTSINKSLPNLAGHFNLRQPE